jgi:hypothetical protein
MNHRTGAGIATPAPLHETEGFTMKTKSKPTFSETLKLLRSQRQELANELSRLDKSIVDFTHLLEFADLPEEVMQKVCADFIQTLRQRRECKDNISLLQSIDSKINVKKYYRPRVSSVEFEIYSEYTK